MMRALVAVAILSATSCGDAPVSSPAGSFTGSIRDTAHEPVAGATLFAIPAALVAWSPLRAGDVTSNATADFDEPLERLVDAQGMTFPSAVTDRQGAYALSLPAGQYYLYVAPDPKADPVHLPGGSAARVSRSAADLLAAGRLDITVSSQPSSFDPKNLIGTEACLGCHAEKASWKNHAHANGIHQPGKASPLQSATRIGLVDAPMLAKFAADTTLYYYAYDATRGDDKFKVQEGGQPPAQAEFSYRLFQDGGQLKAQFHNLINAANDPVDGQTFSIDFFYGGLLMKQRLISRLNSGPNAPTQSGAYFIFPPVQLQPGGTTAPPLGNDRRRWPWLDVRAADFWDPQAQRFKVPPLKQTFDAQCSSCHFLGFSMDNKTLESTAFETPSGIPWKTPDRLIEGNLGCEFCHGPGKEHRDASTAGRAGQYIVQPAHLAAEREMAICGQCHSRPVGNDSLGIHDQPPLNQDNQMAPPGTRRKLWRAEYTSRPDGNPATDYWDDGIHSRPNRQQFSDLMKSKKFVNPQQLVACTDCHDVHGGHTDPVSNPRGLVASVDDNALCLKCHTLNTSTGPGATYHELHTLIGQLRPNAAFRCVNCHMDVTGKTGAGTPSASDPAHQYFDNDIRDHSFIMPRRDNPGVTHYSLADAAIGKAMPIPYTRACGECHHLDTISPAL